MCGINGIISKQNIANIEERINRMNRSLAHRGPNAEQCRVESKNVALGHRRLSILDLDIRANQPMQLQNGKWIVVFNGEIFNFKELRQELIHFYNFKTQSDTEVLLAAVEFKGIDWLLARANGMFAFALYNVETKELYLARDRFGMKPIFVVQDNDKVIFSSEIKGILNSGLIQPQFNPDAIDDYLANRYVREPYTFFKNIFQLKSATYIHFDKDLNKKETQYWNLPALNFSSSYNLPDLIEQTDEQLQKAFNRWFIADVPVGAYLSGGVDSSLTTAILSKYAKQPISTYTIGFEADGFNEFQYARQVADIYKTNHKEILLKKEDYFEHWDKLIYYKDAPLAVPNEIPLAHMSSVLSKDITVVISGEGADELFGGYGRIYRSAFDFKNHPDAAFSFYDYFIKQYEYVPREIRDKYLTVSKSFRSEFDNVISTAFANYRDEENIFRFFHQYHVQGLLQRVDMTTMQTGVEARPPFLDHELIEFVYTHLPYDTKLCWNNAEAKNEAVKKYSSEYSEVLDTPKFILKKVAEKYLPKDIIYRPKMGFPVPLSAWFPNLAEQAEILNSAKWLDTKLIPDLLNDMKKNSRPGQLLWMFINIELFYNQYFNKNWIW